jgi:hypothetical protein
MIESFRLSDLNKHFIQEMVMAMYAYEASMPLDPNLLNEDECHDFYMAYTGADSR